MAFATVADGIFYLAAETGEEFTADLLGCIPPGDQDLFDSKGAELRQFIEAHAPEGYSCSSTVDFCEEYGVAREAIDALIEAAGLKSIRGGG